MPGDSCLSFLTLLFCGPRRRGGSTKTPDSMKVKIRVGFDGKDTLIDPTTLNVKTTFGIFAVLLEYANNRVVPLDRDGFAGETLDPRKKYVIVLNTHGSSQKQWDVQRGGNGKHKKKHHSKHKSKKSKKDKKENKEKDKKGNEGESGGSDTEAELSTIASDSFTSKDFAAASKQSLLSSASDDESL